jgi:hypothetical protein
MSKFSRMLSRAALACAALTAGTAFAGDCGRHPCGAPHAGYHGRTAGHTVYHIPAVKPHNVNVYAGGRSTLRPGPTANVTIYSGGGGQYVNYVRVPEYVDGLEIVTVTRGAGLRGLIVDAVCASRDGHEMPAARLRRTSQVDPGANIELFRCETGFLLTGFVRLAKGNAAGHEVACAQGQSLWSGRDGSVHCRDKQPLGWSEAKLRHAYGVGAITLGGDARMDHAAVIVTRGLSLSGGVGYAPY